MPRFGETANRTRETRVLPGEREVSSQVSDFPPVTRKSRVFQTIYRLQGVDFPPVAKIPPSFLFCAGTWKDWKSGFLPNAATQGNGIRNFSPADGGS
jgi:hypothetical protein